MSVDLAKELQAVGFSEKQAKVYVACLELGPSPVQKIAQRAGLVRPTAYVIVDELKGRGLIQEVVMKKKKMFSAVDPENVFALLRKEQTEHESKIKKFQSVIAGFRNSQRHTTNYPKIVLYEGYEGIERMRESVTTLSTSSIDEFVPLDLAYQYFPPGQNDHRSKVNSLPPLRTLYSSKKNELPDTKKQRRQKVQLDGGFSTEIVITDNGVYFLDLGNKLLSVAIEHEGIAKSMRQLFGTAWKKPGQHK
jgi:sugar-specific transcriptional regulator TrmB